MLECEGFVGGTAIAFLWEIHWYGLVVYLYIITEFLFAYQCVDLEAGKSIQ